MSQKQPTTEPVLRNKVWFDAKGYASGENDYLWIGDNHPGSGCYTHTTSLRSLRALHRLLGAMIRRRERRNRMKVARARR